jgi:hypothetical protein
MHLLMAGGTTISCVHHRKNVAGSGNLHPAFSNAPTERTRQYGVLDFNNQQDHSEPA